MGIPAKKIKRAQDLIRSGKAALVLLVLSLLLGPLGPLPMALGFYYYFASKSLLKKYGDAMSPDMEKDLREARRRFFVLGMIPLVFYGVLIVAFLVIFIYLWITSPVDAGGLGL